MPAERDWRWDDAPRPDPDTGRLPLAPTAAAHDLPALRAEARAWCADPARTLRSAIVADLEHALGAALARAEAAERDRDRLARRLRAVGAIARGARVPDELADADPGPCGWTAR